LLTDSPQLSETQLCSCRLCGAESRRIYVLQVLGKYDVAYFKCAMCESLQTQTPYWLDESYTHNLATLDTGAAQRNLSNLAATYLVARVFSMKDVLDFGGGDGLLCRLLRDYRINCFVNDKYAQANYARAYVAPDFARPQIQLAFEVLEHFAEPRSDLTELFRMEPQILICSTGIFSDQGADWWYLTPETGQHVFFYSRNALQLIANRFGYTLLICSMYALFFRGSLLTFAKRTLLKTLLEKHMLRLFSAAMRLLPPTGVSDDFNSLRSRK
jgi:hypothetical protein